MKDVKKTRQPPQVARYFDDTKNIQFKMKNEVEERISNSPVRWGRGRKPVLS
jgi:hypothetical protein